MRQLLLFAVGCMLLVALPASAALRGVTFYEQGEYSKARKTLEKELRSPKLSKAERSKARLYLAAALYASGAEESARIQLEELALTDPSLKVDPVIFPQGFVTLAEQSRERVAAKATPAAPAPAEQAAPSPAPASPSANAGEEFKRRLTAGIRLYESLEYERALQQVQRAKEVARTSDQDVTASLYEGLILADMGQGEQSLAAFKTALLLNPEAKLPVKASPKVSKDFEDLRLRVREELTRNERKQAEAQATAQPPPPTPEQPASPAPAEQPPRLEEAPPTRSVHLRPELFGFLDPIGKAVGAGGGLTLGLGSLELGARVLLGEELGVGVEAGFLLGSGAVSPRIALRGTAIPSVSSYGGGAAVGLRLRPTSRLTFLVDVGAEYFSTREGYRPLTLTTSAGLGFDLF
jgi:tetratricopeptide (TPR) repeat protein